MEAIETKQTYMEALTNLVNRMFGVPDVEVKTVPARSRYINDRLKKKKSRARIAYERSVLLDKIVDRLVKPGLYDDELGDEVTRLEDGKTNEVQGFTSAEIAERVKLRRKYKNL